MQKQLPPPASLPQQLLESVTLQLRAAKAMKAAEKRSGYIEVGLKIADELLRLGEHAGIPLVGSVCTAARRVLAVLKAASKAVADAVEVG